MEGIGEDNEFHFIPVEFEEHMKHLNEIISEK